MAEYDQAAQLQQNKAVVGRFVAALANKQVDEAASLVAPNFVYEAPGFPQLQNGPEEFRQLMGAFYANSPRLQFKVESESAEANRVVTHYTWQTVHEREFMGMPPTGRTLTVSAIAMHEVDSSGRITRRFVLDDYLNLFRQLGAVPVGLLQESMVIPGVNELRKVAVRA
jgi:steroid delta-isomerase-like uncharacterized protein